MKNLVQKEVHFIALVEMGGNYKGQVAQHSIIRSTTQGAKGWADKRFNRDYVLVDMREHGDGLSLPLGVAEMIYRENTK